MIEHKDADVRSLHHHEWKKVFGASTSRMTNVKKLAELLCQYTGLPGCPLDGDLILRCDKKIKSPSIRDAFFDGKGTWYVPEVDLSFYLNSSGFIEGKRSKEVNGEWKELFKTSTESEYLLDGSIPWQRRLLFGVSNDIFDREQRIATLKDQSGKEDKPIITPSEPSVKLPILREPYLKTFHKLAELVGKGGTELSEEERANIERWAYSLYERALADDRTLCLV